MLSKGVNENIRRQVGRFELREGRRGKRGRGEGLTGDEELGDRGSGRATDHSEELQKEARLLSGVLQCAHGGTDSDLGFF